MIKKLMSLFSKSRNYESLHASELAETLKNDKQAVLLDVRNPGEYSSGHIPGARNINVMDGNFAEKIKGLDTSKNYYVYCASGGRSGVACTRMAGAGFQHLVNVTGGIMAYNGKLKK